MNAAAPGRSGDLRFNVGVHGVVTLMVILGAGAFLYCHTGARADGLCGDKVFVRGGTFSWSHLAVRCEYGEPLQASYERGLSFLVLLALCSTWLVSLVAVLAMLWRQCGRLRVDAGAP